MTKQNKTWAIEENIADDFAEICKEEGLVQAVQVEKMLEKWVQERQK